MTLAARNKKARERHLARAAWRSFGEYAFLEDSRYTSQVKNVRRDGMIRRAGVMPISDQAGGIGREFATQ
jgi:hypothetical protein